MCPYVGGSLTSLFNEKPQAATKLAARRLADRGADLWHTVTVENSPIKTGNLRSSWYVVPAQKVVHPWGDAYEAKVESYVPYAPHVEHGTGLWGPDHRKYLIAAKPGHMLRWRGPGGDVYRHAVMHPGSPGQHMLSLGGEIARAALDDGSHFDGVMHEWARTVEASAD